MKTFVFALCLALSGLGGATIASAGEAKEREAIKTAAKSRFLAERFEELDAAARDMRAARALTGSGQSKLAFFYEALSSPKALYGASDTAALDRMDAKIEAWLKANPRSPSANVLRAEVLLARAWLARGYGYAVTVRPEQWVAMSSFVIEGVRRLESSRAFAAIDPQWHATYLGLAQIGSFPNVSFDLIANEALSTDAAYFPIYDKVVLAAAPRWGGSWQAVDDAVEELVARTAKDLGQTLYARAYNWVASVETKRGLFEKSLAKWPRMKQGFEDLTARYPTDWNFNLFGVNACFAQDWTTLASIFDRLGDRVLDELWYAKSTRESCQRAVEGERRNAEDIVHYSKPMRPAEEMVERFRIEDEATAALLGGRFDEIEAVRAAYVRTGETTASGAWKLASYAEGLSSFRRTMPGAGPEADQIRSRVKEWRAAHPQSIAAAVAAARLALADAKSVQWVNARIEPGKGASDFARALQSAKDQLEAVRAAGERDPVWWSTRMLVELWDVGSEAEFLAMAERALAVAPDYTELRTVVLSRAQPAEPTFVAAYQRLTDLMLSATKGGQDEAYADVFLALADRYGQDTIVSGMKVDWPRMRRGLDAIVARWPSDWNLTAYARFACMAQDRPKTAELMARLGDRLVEQRWYDWRAHGRCRDWAVAAN